MSSLFHVKGELVPYGDSLSQPVKFEVQAESFPLFIENLLSLGASIQSSGFDNVQNAMAIIDQAGFAFSEIREGYL